MVDCKGCCHHTACTIRCVGQTNAAQGYGQTCNAGQSFMSMQMHA